MRERRATGLRIKLRLQQEALAEAVIPSQRGMGAKSPTTGSSTSTHPPVRA